MSKFSTIHCQKFTLLLVSESPSRVRLCPKLLAALRRPQKKYTPGFWNMDFVDCVIFEWFVPPCIFCDFELCYPSPKWFYDFWVDVVNFHGDLSRHLIRKNLYDVLGKSMDIWIWRYMDIWIFNEPFEICDLLSMFRRFVVKFSEMSSKCCPTVIQVLSIVCQSFVQM